jgi:shikimate kinase
MSSKINFVYLTGFMGSGKTTAGKELASRLDWAFIDLDRYIEKHTGNTVPEIFNRYGEDYFRCIESLNLLNLEASSDTIVSTGGGTPCYNENMEFMVKNGITIYLKMTTDQLWKRLHDVKADRPLIKDLDDDELRSFISGKLSEREQWYERSEIIVDGSAPDIDSLINNIKSRLII